jgi:hypothetical protein
MGQRNGDRERQQPLDAIIIIANTVRIVSLFMASSPGRRVSQTNRGCGSSNSTSPSVMCKRNAYFFPNRDFFLHRIALKKSYGCECPNRAMIAPRERTLTCHP